MKNSNTQRYLIGGFLFGLLFPIFSWLLDGMVFHDLTFGWDMILKIHTDNPLHFVIDSAPFVLSIAFGLTGMNLDRNAKNKELREKNLDEYNQENNALVRKMQLATWIAPSLLFILMTISFFVLQSFLSKQQNDASVINISGRQRMLSQRIAKGSVYLTITNGEDQVRHINALNQSIKEFKEAHQNLIKKSNTLGFSESYELSDKVQNLYDSLEPYYQRLLINANDLVTANDLPDSPQRTEKIRNHFEQIERSERAFLPIMNSIVFTYTEEGEAKITYLRIIQGAVALLVALFAFSLAAFGLQPIIGRVKQAFFDIEDASNELATQNEQIKASEEEIRQNAEELTAINDNLKVSERTLKTYINRVGEAKKLAKLAAYDFDVVTGKVTHTEHLNYVLGLDKDVKITDEIIAERINPEDKKMVFDKRQEAIAHRIDTFYRFRIKSGDTLENWRWVQGVTHVILDENNKLDYVVNVVQDITETVKKELEIQELLKESQEKQQELAASEEELRQNSEQLQLINDNLFVAQREIEEKQQLLTRAEEIALMGSFALDLETNEYSYSENLAVIYGLDSSEMTNPFRHIKYFHEEDKKAIETQAAEMMQGKRNEIALTIRFKGIKHTEWKFLKLDGYLLRNTNGNPFRILGVVQDVTKEVLKNKKVELLLDAVSKNKTYLDEAQTLAKIVSYDMDIYSKKVEWSDSFVEVFEIEPEETPKTIDDFQLWIAEKDLEKAEEGWAKAVIEKTSFDEKYPITTPKGTLFYIRERGYPIFDKDGNLIAIRGTLQDVTKTQLAQEEIEYKSKVIEKQNTKFVSSVNYAQRIQSAMLGGTQDIQNIFKDAFIFFEPKDVVSGDFYWYAEQGTRKIAIVGDCTGHGVPGAFMSLLGTTILNDIIRQRQITTPSLILDELQKEIRNILNQDNTGNRDGMDMAVVVVNETDRILEFAGAKNPLVYIHKKRKKGGLQANLTIIKGDNLPIGGRKAKTTETTYTNHTISLENIDAFYLYSDGYQDQFGGKEGGKFMSTKFRQLLYDTHSTSMRHQRVALKRALMNWMGVENEQIDDICVMGITI
ncbi:PAS domain-containing protein [Bernardetia sp. ABR2-2B]|uniref:PAS domain-containing protein n=1 Tax=Bernardetia sp. ABR2-2B TaxID=3127472 RepID=UPI0030CE80CF